MRITAGLPGLWGSLASISRFRCHVYCGPMHGFEQGDLIVRPNWLLAGSMGILAAMIAVGCLRVRRGRFPQRSTPATWVDLNGRIALLDRILKWRPLQFACTLPVLACFAVVVLAGFFGTKVGGRNVAVMLTWVAWMSLLTVLMVPIGGRIWCLVCPLPVLGEYLQRGATTQVRHAETGRYGNRFFGLGRRWFPGLQGPWVRLIFFLSLGTLSASLAGQPRWTAMCLLGMILAAAGMSLLWELRGFCRFVCPVASYISGYCVTAPLMVHKRDPGVCRRCKENGCIRGNAQGWACPYGLSVARMDNNLDCGMCTECFKSCPHDNVMLGWRKGPWSHRFSSYGEAWQAIALLVLAAASSLTIHSPWPMMRDIVNVVDKATWPQFGLYALVLWALALGLVPAILWVACGFGMRLGQKSNSRWMDGSSGRFPLFSPETGDVFRRTMPALIPLGLALWAAFFASTVMTNFTFVLMTLSDPFGWGWDLFGTAGMPWRQLWPSGIPWIQTVMTLTGLFFSFRKGLSFWLGVTGEQGSAIRGFAPTALFLAFFAGAALFYFTNC